MFLVILLMFGFFGLLITSLIFTYQTLIELINWLLMNTGSAAMFGQSLSRTLLFILITTIVFVVVVFLAEIGKVAGSKS